MGQLFHTYCMHITPSSQMNGQKATSKPCQNIKVFSHLIRTEKVNFNKSKVFGIGFTLLKTIHQVEPLSCEVACLPFTYVVLPVGANMNLKKNQKPIIDRFMIKLTTWKSKTPSFRRRLTLILSVLGNLPTYYLLLFPAPNGVLEQLKKLGELFYGVGLMTHQKSIGYHGKISQHAKKIGASVWDRSKLLILL